MRIQAIKKGSGFLAGIVLCTILCTLMTVTPVSAKGEDTILGGIYVDALSLEGKTESQARTLVEEYAAGLAEKSITLLAVNDNSVTITPAMIGFSWSNPEIIQEACALGKKGNVIQRYKAIKDLENNNKTYKLEFSLDTALIADIITEQCEVYNVPTVNAAMSRVDGEIQVTEGQAGLVVDTATSVDIIYDYLQSEWNKEDCTIELAVIVEEPRGSVEELSKLTDILGTFTTSYSTSNGSRSANVANGCRLIDGSCLYPGEEYSAYQAVSPFSSDNGYYMAGSYLNGQVVDSLGGGICQVSTTLYNAVLLAELEVTERHNHSMIVTYVQPSMDAAIAESSGKDFKFINNTENPIYIEGITTPDKHITFTIYGVENRPASRTVEYISEVLEKKEPETEAVYPDAGLPVGSVSVQSAHIGYKAQLWKVVKENGAEVSKEKVNSSSYQVSPRSATVGIATEDPNALEQIMAAIATNNIDHIKNVAAILRGETPAPPAGEAAAPPEQPQPDPEVLEN